MGQYLLSVHSVEGQEQGPPPSPEAMQGYMQAIMELESEMDAAGAFSFGGALHGPNAATVVRAVDGDTTLTDGPFAEAKEHIAGFYIINTALIIYLIVAVVRRRRRRERRLQPEPGTAGPG